MPRRPRDAALLQRFGAHVARLRGLTGLTQQTVADRIGVRPEAISQMESGKLSPTLTSVMALARALGVRPGALFEFEEGVPVVDPVGADEVALLAGYRALDDAGRDVIRTVVRGVAR